MRHRRVRQKQMQKRAWTAGGTLLFSIVSGLITFLAAKRRRERPQRFWQRLSKGIA